jgi:hypothetical protein
VGHEQARLAEGEDHRRFDAVADEDRRRIPQAYAGSGSHSSGVEPAIVAGLCMAEDFADGERAENKAQCEEC